MMLILSPITLNPGYSRFIPPRITIDSKRPRLSGLIFRIRDSHFYCSFFRLFILYFLYLTPFPSRLEEADREAADVGVVHICNEGRGRENRGGTEREAQDQGKN